jgi:AcrR family transcriptional regulator
VLVARTVDDEAHALRRDEFLDVAQRLLETKGYERMSVQDVLAELGASKGAFYHYFGSKQALLEAVVDRLADAVAASLAPVAGRSDAMALNKLDHFFAALATWKTRRRDLLVALLRVWQSDDNAIVRQKLRPGIADRIAPLLAGIIDQGIQEGVFTATYPEQTARVIVSLVQDLNDRLATLFLATETGQGDWLTVEHTVTAHTHALARVLGVPAGSVVLVDPAVLRWWFDPEHGFDPNESGER